MKKSDPTYAIKFTINLDNINVKTRYQNLSESVASKNVQNEYISISNKLIKKSINPNSINIVYNNDVNTIFNISLILFPFFSIYPVNPRAIIAPSTPEMNDHANTMINNSNPSKYRKLIIYGTINNKEPTIADESKYPK